MKLHVIPAILSLVAAVLAAEPVAIVKSSTGSVQVKRNGQYLPLQKGEELFGNDLIQTGVDGRTGFIFNDGTRISIGPKSILAINRYLFNPAQSDYLLDLNLSTGSAAFESGKIGKTAPQKVRFHVPQGFIGIRGTKFVVEAE